MGRLYSWLNFLNASRKRPSYDSNVVDIVKGGTHYALDLLFFTNRRGLIAPFHPWVGLSLLKFFSTFVTDLTFYTILPVIKKKRRWSSYIRSYNFTNLKGSLGWVVDHTFSLALVDSMLVTEDYFYLEAALWVVYVLNKHFFTHYVLTALGIEVGYEVTPPLASFIFLNRILTASVMQDSFISWAPRFKASTTALALAQSDSIVGWVRTSMPDSVIIDMVTGANLAPLASSVLKSSTATQDLSIILVNSIDFYPSGALDKKFSITAFFSGPVSAKSYTLRSRQFYRTGFFWSASLTSLFLIGPYYLFYGFTTTLSYWWLPCVFFFLRAGVVYTWKFVPAPIRYKATNLLF